MNKKSCLWLGLFGLIIICISGAALMYFQTRARSFNSRPLVLLHSPVNHTQVKSGDGVLVHATIRTKNGIARAELWADDVLVATRTITDGSKPPSLVFSENWIASTTGNHVLIVRAFSADGTDGQASTVVEVRESGEANGTTYTVQEGDTAESIASNYGTTPEELAASNPDLGSGAPTPGDELVIPDSEPPTALEEPPTAEGDDVPAPEGESPAESGFDFFGFFGTLEGLIPQDGELTGLRVEILSLQTGESLEGLHCYVGFGGAPPRWYPDADNDQSTDESFSQDGPTNWNVQEHFAAGSAPVIFWPRNEPISLSVSCVGIAAGGTDALELGRWEEDIDPERWTGMPLSGNASGADGSFEFTFRITRVNSIPLFLDTGMTPPTNARIDDRRISLRWDYDPPADEEPITGFRIYLNGNLQWVESADARESGLPYEWLNPPCGSTYTFNVTAYRFGLPDGPESLPAIAIVQPEAIDCQREVLITFLTLETFDLGGDGSYEDRHGDVGPAYGYFFANEQQITFNGGHLGPGLDMPSGFSHNSTYDLMAMSADSGWHFNGMPALVVDVPDGGTFEFGYNIMDEDSGDCDDSDDPGCDDPICEGLSMIYDENSPAGYFDEQNEGALTSEDGRCRVTYRWGPAAGSPVGSGVPGWEPLPWIDVESFDIDETTGQVRINIRNNGTATWPWRDLDVELRNRDGTSLGIYTWEGFVLEPGQRTVLESPQMRVDAPFDACVLIDPYNSVLEEYERSGALYHNPICPRLPDLTINNVQFDSSGGGRILVTVQNIGDGTVENRDLNLQTFFADGSPAYLVDTDSIVTLAPRETRVFDIPGVTESARNSLANGYTVVVNRDGIIPESDTENNSFSVSPYQLQMWWCDARIPHYRGLGSTARMFLTVEVINATSTRAVFEASRTDTLSSRETFAYGYNHVWEQGHSDIYFSCNETSEPFNILGDESLRISIHADFLAGSAGDRENLGTANETYTADRFNLFPVNAANSFDNYCPRYNVIPPLGMLEPEPWFSSVCIGQITP